MTTLWRQTSGPDETRVEGVGIFTIRIRDALRLDKGGSVFSFGTMKEQNAGSFYFLRGKTVNYSRIKSLIDKLVADASLRKKHRRELRFPIEDHYRTYPAFPEEAGA